VGEVISLLSFRFFNANDLKELFQEGEEALSKEEEVARSTTDL
jgi:hypothetical protein